MHGGLFNKDNVTLEQIRQIDRVRQPPEEGLMCDILWSDPMANVGRSPSKRGVGVQFGPDVTENFLKVNKLDYIIRSHEVKESGYEVVSLIIASLLTIFIPMFIFLQAHNGKCITVFSAPNYCDQMGNLGAFITFKGGDLTPKFTSFKEVPHPDKKPMCYSSNLFNFAS